jgi:hypothetical protein
MAGLVPAIHELSSKEDVDARHKAGHDGWGCGHGRRDSRLNVEFVLTVGVLAVGARASSFHDTDLSV